MSTACNLSKILFINVLFLTLNEYTLILFVILFFQFDFNDIRIQFFFEKSAKSISCYMIGNFSTILAKKSTTFDRCMITLLKSINFENFDVESNLNTLIKFENEVENDDESINIINMIVLTTADENVIKTSSILLITRTLSIEIVVVVAYAVTQTIKNFLNQSFLYVNFDFLAVSGLIFSVCFEFI